MASTDILFLNHASVLIRHGDEYLLCDPWFERPAFGSWLPVPPLFVHPAYLTGLGRKLSLLISHGHDDHCDDELLELFDKNTPIFSSDYASPSVKNRVKKLGLENYIEASPKGVRHGAFTVRSFRNEDLSLDDALYTIRTPDAFIVHANDCWPTLTDEMRECLKREVAEVGPEHSLFMSQTNSASGYPLTYVCYEPDERKRILRDKVHGMITTGMQNAKDVGARYFHSYAGYAGVFVKGRDSYLSDNLFPTPQYIREELSESIPEGVELLDFYPGDVFDFERVQPSFFGRNITDAALRESSERFYFQAGRVQKCDSYADDEPESTAALQEKLRVFLEHFNDFVVDKTARSSYEATVLGKTLVTELNDRRLVYSLTFGEGQVPRLENDADFQKKLIVSSQPLTRVLNGESWFENLYTGYGAEFSRQPADEYHHDIVAYMVMYSYVYKNRILPSLKREAQPV